MQLGCAAGEATDGNCKAGAIGATTAELIAGIYGNSQIHEIAHNPDLADNGALIGKLGAVIVAFIAGEDETGINIAADTADTAVEYNYLNAILGIASAALSAEAIVDAYKEGGINAAALQAGIEIIEGASGQKLFKFGGKIFKTAEAAFAEWRVTNTATAKFADKLLKEFESSPIGSNIGSATKKIGDDVFVSRGSTGRTEPRDLKEQLAMEEVKANPKGNVLPNIKLKDSRWHDDDGWDKMSQDVNDTQIHYVRNRNTGEVDDFKFNDNFKNKK